MVQDAILVCGNCGNETQVNSMKYNSSGDFLICKRCYHKEHDMPDVEVEEAVEAELKELEMPLPTKPKICTVEHLDYERINYQCTHCGYKYSRKKEADYNMQCPYCGKFTAEVATAMGAEELLQESTSIFTDVDRLMD